MVFDVINRGVARMTIFENDGDYEAFDRVLERSDSSNARAEVTFAQHVARIDPSHLKRILVLAKRIITLDGPLDINQLRR